MSLSEIASMVAVGCLLAILLAVTTLAISGALWVVSQMLGYKNLRAMFQDLIGRDEDEK